MYAAQGGQTETCVQLHAWGADPNLVDRVRVGLRCYFPLLCLTAIYYQYFPVATCTVLYCPAVPVTIICKHPSIAFLGQIYSLLAVSSLCSLKLVLLLLFIVASLALFSD